MANRGLGASPEHFREAAFAAISRGGRPSHGGGPTSPEGTTAYVLPASVARSIDVPDWPSTEIATAERSRAVCPASDLIFASFSFPPAQARSISNPPRARKPRTLPAGQALGSAGRNRISPAWLW